MADERERAAWLRTMTATAYTVKALNGEELDPNDMLPANLRPPRTERALTPEQEQHETDRAIDALIAAFKGMQ